MVDENQRHALRILTPSGLRTRIFICRIMPYGELKISYRFSDYLTPLRSM
jgi:hypothetical protein